MNKNMSATGGSPARGGHGAFGGKKRLIKGILALSIALLALPAPAALAAPFVSISSAGGNSLTISVSNAPAFSPVDLIYTLPGSTLPTVIANVGNTSAGGFWSGTLSMSDYGIINGSQVYVSVGGQQSNVIIVGSTGGCTYNCGSPYGLSLSQNNVALNVGQTMTVTALNYGSSIYMASNSNPAVVSASVAGSQINLYGLASGTSNVSVCSSSSGYVCASIYVTVSGFVAGASNYQVLIGDNYFSPPTITLPAGSSVTWRNTGSMVHTVTFDNLSGDSGSIYPGSTYSQTFNLAGTYTYHCRFHAGMIGTVAVTGSSAGTGNLWFNPSSPTLYVGQSLAVSISSNVSSSAYSTSGANAYYVSANSNPSVVSASVVGTVLNLYANAVGSASLSICHVSLNFCGTLTVSVSGGGYAGDNLTFSQSNVNLNQGQNLNINIYGGSGTYYISNNPNPNLVNASIAGSTVYLYGQAQGSSQITVCQNNTASCGTLYVTVFGSGGSGSGLWFSQSSVNLNLNQSLSVSIYSSLGNNYYLSANSNPGAVTASVVGNSLNLYGNAIGSSNLTVCHTTASGVCGTLFVSVGNGYGSGNLSLSQNSLNLAVGQSGTITVYNNVGSLYVSSNSNPAVAGAGVSGNTITVYASNPGSANLSLCQNNASGCVSLLVMVSGYSSGSLSFVTTGLPSITLGQFYSYQIQVAGGTPPYNFSLISGSLPAGLSLANSGMISGTALSGAASSFAVRVSDNFSRANTANFYIAGSLSGSGSGSLSGGVLGTSIYKNGQLIKEGGTIYIVYRNLKSGFAALAAFRGFGFKLANVLDVGNSGLNNSGYIISTASGSHPWGSWIKSGQTVYFVHETGLMPVPDWNTFLNNGGQANLPVSANLSDFSLPMLSVMAVGDSRLQ